MIREIRGYNFRYIYKTPNGGDPPALFCESEALAVERFHRQLPGYHVTDLARLRALARSWGVRDIFVKDESTRFGLQAFKVLGSSYAVARLVCRQLGRAFSDATHEYLTSEEVRQKVGRITLATATDGNHGRGVAWAAKQLGQNAAIFMPKGTVRTRVENIRKLGARVEVTDLNYDDTVRLVCKKAEENGWHIVQDTAWEGYEGTPTRIMQGYMTMCVEAARQLEVCQSRPTHVFVQAGVGALAAGVVGYFANRYRDNPPKFVILEPANAACFLVSVEAGQPRAVTGDLDTIMVGLACGEPSLIAWPILRDFPCCYVSMDNYVAANAVRILANPLDGDPAIRAGESGPVGIGLTDLLVNHPAFAELKAALEIGSDSSLLFFCTEGVTDPENYREIVWHGKYPAVEMG